MEKRGDEMKYVILDKQANAYVVWPTMTSPTILPATGFSTKHAAKDHARAYERVVYPASRSPRTELVTVIE